MKLGPIGGRALKYVKHGLKRLIARLDGNTVYSKRLGTREASFRIKYERFREILTLNDSTLELITDIEEVLGADRSFSLEAMARRTRKAAMDVFLMVKDLNLIADNRHAALYNALRNLNTLLEEELPHFLEEKSGRYVIPLRDLRWTDAELVGSKMANLGEVGAVCGFSIPDGFAVTTESYIHFMTDLQLWDKCEALNAALEADDQVGVNRVCHEIQEAIAASPVPPGIADSIQKAFQQHFPDPGIRVAVRSSAVGEDTLGSSHAGLYHTELDVDFGRMLHAYRIVLASMFSPAAVSYRFRRGLTIRDSPMAVGCVRMIRPRCSGILYSRLPDESDADAVMISVVAGIAQNLASGAENAETWVMTAGKIALAVGSLISKEEAAQLVETARRLESHFGTPQDIEWALNQNGELKVFQTRPLATVRMHYESVESVNTDQTPMLEGGFAACPGVGSGPAVIAGMNDALTPFPEGAVLIARHSATSFVQIMDRCAAIVTDIGSPTGHMSSLSREFGIPTIVGLDGATHAIKEGQLITVDAKACRVYNGIIGTSTRPIHAEKMTESPALEQLRQTARLVTPLTLIDPASPEFHPDNCRSLHDITRYVHEKAFEAMFHYGDMAAIKESSSIRLKAKLPITVQIFDVGNGLAEMDDTSASIRPENVLSVPMRSFLEGLLESRIRWDLPRPVSMRGFFSVLGESVAGLPADAIDIGRASYAIISDQYMNFSTKAGYHFSTVDTYCGRSINKNYIHFRFVGGAADEERRRRRVQFLSMVVGALDFRVTIRGDALFAALDKYSAADIQSRLVTLGRLTLCARQLDMLMNSDSSPDFFARAFLAGEWHRF